MVPRTKIGPKRARAVDKFIALLKIHFPERVRAQAYLQEWANRRSTEGLIPPRHLAFLSRFVDETQPFLQQLSADAGLTDHYTHPVKFVSVRREAKRQKKASPLPDLPDFTQYLAARRAQGVAAQTAQSEWNGMMLLRAAASAGCEVLECEDE